MDVDYSATVREHYDSVLRHHMREHKYFPPWDATKGVFQKFHRNANIGLNTLPVSLLEATPHSGHLKTYRRDPRVPTQATGHMSSCVAYVTPPLGQSIVYEGEMDRLPNDTSGLQEILDWIERLREDSQPIYIPS